MKDLKNTQIKLTILKLAKIFKLLSLILMRVNPSLQLA